MRLLLDPNGPQINPRGVSKRLKYAVHQEKRTGHRGFGPYNDQKKRWCSLGTQMPKYELT